MVEYHSDGYQWAEAAVPPSTDSETMMEDDEDEGTDVVSPTSAAHVGSPAPLPPTTPAPLTPTGTEGTDPQHTGIQMGNPVSPTTFLGASPFETIHENFFEQDL